MFIGHYAIGLIAKKETEKVSLATLFIAVLFLDLLWPIFLLLDIEKVVLHPELEGAKNVAFTFYPYSHSLLFTFIWALVFGFIYWLLKKNIKNALILSLCVLSHWLLDMIVHFKDLPLALNNNQLVGLRLWNYAVLSLFVELIFFACGVYIYLKTTTPKNKYGSILILGVDHLTFNFTDCQYFLPRSFKCFSFGLECSISMAFYYFGICH